MTTVSAIVGAMIEVAPPGQAQLDENQLHRLDQLTRLLVAGAIGVSDSRRFHEAPARSLVVPAIGACSRRRTIVVTGGTGCIGSALLHQLRARSGDRIVSVSRGVTAPTSDVAGVEYRTLDIRSASAVSHAFAAIRPDVVYHLAAVRDPALAEIEVERTVATNILGTANVVAAAESSGVQKLVYASTGKAVRFYTSDVYAATKRVGERLVANAGVPVSSFVRYTHVADNSLILQKLSVWCSGGVVRLHAPDLAFHIQSALESAQSLIVASRRSGLYTIRDLGWPIGLLDLAVGVMRETGRVAPIYFCGYEPGYEAESYPGLYDPASGGQTGPLINALESYSARPALADQMNYVPVAKTDSRSCGFAVDALRRDFARSATTTALRERLNEISLGFLANLVARTPPDRLARIIHFSAQYNSLNREHQIVDLAMRSGQSAAVGSGRYTPV